MRISAKRYAHAFYEATSDVKGKERDAIIARFIEVLARRNSLSLAERIIAEYQAYAAAKEGRARIDITIARKLSAAAEKALATQFEKTLKRDVTLTAHVDPAIIGGAVIRYGDTVIDGSVQHALSDLKKSLAS
jgi:F-type H+-transporting ATPase subunit delta